MLAEGSGGWGVAKVEGGGVQMYAQPLSRYAYVYGCYTEGRAEILGFKKRVNSQDKMRQGRHLCIY